MLFNNQANNIKQRKKSYQNYLLSGEHFRKLFSAPNRLPSTHINGPFESREREGEWSRLEYIQYKISLFLTNSTLLSSIPPLSKQAIKWTPYVSRAWDPYLCKSVIISQSLEELYLNLNDIIYKYIWDVEAYYSQGQTTCYLDIYTCLCTLLWTLLLGYINYSTHPSSISMNQTTVPIFIEKLRDRYPEEQ